MKPDGPEYQIIDDTHNSISLKAGAIRKTGSLDGVIGRAQDIPLNVDRQRGLMGWNEGRIIVYGARVEHWLNGVLVVSFDLGSQALRSALRSALVRVGPAYGGKYKSRIYLQDEGSEVSYRSLRVRDLTKPIPKPAGAGLAP
jgi:hypothetical protein